MSKLWVIARKDIREAFRSRSTYFYIVLLFVFGFIYASSYSTLINRITAGNPGQDVIIQQSQTTLNSIASGLPLVFAIWICTIFATYSVVVEKAKRNLESLMATPVRLNQIWLGKTLAVTLPSVIIGLVVSAIVYIAMNFVLVVPKIGIFITPGAVSIITAVILSPLLIFTVVSLVLYLQLVISNPRIANFAFIVIFFLLFFGVNILTQMGVGIDLSLIYAGVLVVCAGVSYLLSRSLTKEKVLLSSKG